MAKKRPTIESLYLKVVILDNGQAAFGKYVENPTAESKIITTKNTAGKEFKKNYELFDEIEGIVKTAGVWDKETEQGAKWEMTSITLINAEGTDENVQVNFKSRFSASLITRLENIDLSKPVRLKVFRIKDGEKKDKNGAQKFNEILLPYQQNANGVWESVKNKYAAEFAADDTAKANNLNPHKLPDFVKKTKKVKGADVTEWNTDEYEEALRQIAIKFNGDAKNALQWHKQELENNSKESETGEDVNENIVGGAQIENEVKDDMPW